MKTIALTLMAAAAGGAGGPEPLHPSLLAVPPGFLAPAIVASGPTGYVDGTYAGATVDSIWGPVQVQAVIQGGRIANLKMLRYPSDRRESLFISQAALPRLRDEVVKAQAANVDIISGATLTSQAFTRSLDVALAKARAAKL